MMDTTTRSGARSEDNAALSAEHRTRFAPSPCRPSVRPSLPRQRRNCVPSVGARPKKTRLPIEIESRVVTDSPNSRPTGNPPGIVVVGGGANRKSFDRIVGALADSVGGLCSSAANVNKAVKPVVASVAIDA